MDIRTKLAESLIDVGDLGQAKIEFEIMPESRPPFAGARLWLGVVLHRIGDPEGAIREWTQCTVDDPQDMRPRAYLASAGVTFPHVHRGQDEDTPEGDEERSED